MRWVRAFALVTFIVVLMGDIATVVDSANARSPVAVAGDSWCSTKATKWRPSPDHAHGRHRRPAAASGESADLDDPVDLEFGCQPIAGAESEIAPVRSISPETATSPRMILVRRPRVSGFRTRRPASPGDRGADRGDEATGDPSRPAVLTASRSQRSFG
jgi:hypothetical protein